MKNKKDLIILDISLDKDIRRENCNVIKIDKGNIKLKKFIDLTSKIDFKKNNDHYNKTLSFKIIKYLKKFEKYLSIKDLLLTELANLRDDKVEIYDKIKSFINLKKLNLEKNYKIEIISDKKYANYIYCQIFKNFKIIDFTKEKNLNFYLKFIISRTRFSIKLFVINIYLKFFSKKNMVKNKCVLSIYPITHNAKENFYKIKNFSNLNFLITDETHINTNLIDVIKKINFLLKKKNYFNIEQELKPLDIILHYFYSFKKLKLIKNIRSQEIVINQIDFKYLFSDYFFISILNFLKLDIFRKPLVNFFIKNSQIKEFHFFLFEYNFGFYLSEIIRSKNPKIKLVGYQHGIFGPNTPWFHIVKHYPKYLFTPDKILYRFKESKKNYLSKLPAYYEPNLYNLRKFNKKLIPKINKLNDNCLVFLGLHDGEHIINQILYDENLKKKFKFFFLKYHPKRKDLIFKYKSKKLIFVNKVKNIEVNSIYISSSSSLSYIFKDLKIPHKIFNIPYKSYKK